MRSPLPPPFRVSALSIAVRIRGLLLLRVRSALEAKGRRVDAVAKAGRLGPVVEHMAQRSLARRAAHLGARHEEAPVGVLVHGGVLDGLPEARPPGAGIEL